MKDLIIPAVMAALAKMKTKIPTTGKKTVYSSTLFDVSPLGIAKFMKDNNIPDTAEFCGVDNGYDAFNDFVLSWDIDVPLSKDAQTKLLKDKFNRNIWVTIRDIYLSNGYKITSVWSTHWKQFDDTSLYDMFVAGDYDRFISYYAPKFVKNI